MEAGTPAPATDVAFAASEPAGTACGAAGGRANRCKRVRANSTPAVRHLAASLIRPLPGFSIVERVLPIGSRDESETVP